MHLCSTLRGAPNQSGPLVGSSLHQKRVLHAKKIKRATYDFTHQAVGLIRCAPLGEIQNTFRMHGINANQIDESGISPLMEAARLHRSDVVKWLLSEGARPDAVNKEGSTALMFAVHHQPPSPVKRSMNAEEPYHHPISNTSQLLTIQALLEGGADILHVNQYGITTHGYAVPALHPYLNEYMHSPLDYANKLISMAAFATPNEMTGYAEAHGLTADTPGDFGWTPLFQATLYERTTTVDWLLNTCDAKPNTVERMAGYTPLFVATRRPSGNTPFNLDNRTTLIYLLLKAGARWQHNDRNNFSLMQVCDPSLHNVLAEAIYEQEHPFKDCIAPPPPPPKYHSPTSLLQKSVRLLWMQTFYTTTIARSLMNKLLCFSFLYPESLR